MTNAADSKQWQQAERVFTDRLASRQMIEETSSQDKVATDSLPLSLGKIRNLSGLGVSPFGQGSDPVPMGAIRLYRAFLQRQGLAFSRHARAASSDVVSRRMIGAYQLDIVMEEDALFIIVTLGGNTPPHTMILLHENGQHYTIELAEPVEDMIQQGVARHDSKNKELVKLLLDPVTSITLM